MGQQNSTSKLIKSDWLLICFTFVMKSPGLKVSEIFAGEKVKNFEKLLAERKTRH